jgi:23S rRNA pseudouridine1911/1915/1917 synthase
VCSAPAVKVAGGFVGKQDLWLSRDGASDRRALHFTTAELMGIVVPALYQVDELESFSDACPGFALAPQEEGQLNVFGNRHRRKKVKELKDDSKLVATVSSKVGISRSVERKVSNPDLPRIRSIKAAQQIEQCALAAAAGTSDHSEVARWNLQAYIIESAYAALAPGIDSRDPVKTNHGKFDTGGVKTNNQVEFQILDETDDFLVVDKPAGLLVHPTKPCGSRTLWHGLRELLGYELATGGQLSLVNRLDRETSGIVLVAKNEPAARAAGIALQRGQIYKEYIALIFGWPAWEENSVESPIVRLGEVNSSAVWLERTVHPRGRPAITRFRVESRLKLSRDRCFSVLRVWPQTGRTHQIRVHLASLGYPMVGDKIYARGNRHYLEFIRNGWTDQMASELWLPRHALHASKLSVELCGRHLEWFSPLPDDLKWLIEQATKQGVSSGSS